MTGLIAIAFAAVVCACWAWDSRSLHARVAALEADRVAHH